MNDYLSQLAARSLNQMEVIQPRLVLLFEPLRAAGGSMAIPSLDAEVEQSASSASPTVFEIPALDQPPPSAANGRSAVGLSNRLMIQRVISSGASPHGIAESPVDVVKAGYAAPVSVTPVSAAAQGPVQPSTTQSTVTSATRQRAAGPTRAIPAPTLRQPVLKLPQIQAKATEKPIDSASRRDGEPKNIEASSPREIVEPHVLRKATRPASGPRAEPTRAAVRSTTIPRPESSVEQPTSPHPAAILVVQPRVAPAPLRVQPAAPSEPAPIIRVSIGRIEVRAVMPPALPPAPRATPPPPSLSLDDYLKRLNEERR